MIHATDDTILYAEDDQNDALLLRLALTKAGVLNSLVVVPGGKAAVEYLSGVAAHNDQHPMPRLVLLDLNMPGTSGLEVLKWIRTTPGLCTLIVVMLSSSNQDADIHRAYIQGANGYLVKPSKLDEMVTMAKAIKDYWLMQNRSPFQMAKIEFEEIE
jgi:CheY-like chemotaxis protein